MSAWRDISSAPRDGTPFLASDENDLIQVCFIEHRPEQRRTKRQWFRDVEVVEREGGHFLFYALPREGGYAALNMRPDHGYRPKYWMDFDELPPLPTEASP